MSFAKDRPQWPDGLLPAEFSVGPATPVGGQVLFDDTFNEGLGWWRDHIGGAARHGCISLTSQRTWPGSAYAMMLSPSPRGQGPDCQTYRNMSLDVDQGKIRLEVWLALGEPLTDSDDVTNTIASLFIAMDCQSWLDDYRGLYKLRFRRRSSPDTGSTIIDSWCVPTDSGEDAFILSTGAQTAPTTSPPVAPARSCPFPGSNENKQNLFRVALWIDLSTTPANSIDGVNARPGRYFRAEMGPTIVDLTGFVDSTGKAIGRGKTAPQITSAVGGGPFTGGFNPGIGIVNRDSVNLSYPPVMIVPRVRCTWWPPGVTV